LQLYLSGRIKGKQGVRKKSAVLKYKQQLIYDQQAMTKPMEPEQRRVFDAAAALFAVLATPLRLQILSALCDREKTVSQLLGEIDTTQPNLSQHLAVLFKTGVLAKRKDGTQVIYRVQSEKAVALCRSVCTQIAIEMDEPDAVLAGQSLGLRSADLV
jgi:DNA-binding transcriptional ArsR family regulator